MGIETPPHHPNKLVIRETLSAASAELCTLAALSKEIQWAISSLLEKDQHPDLFVELQILQDIDRLQQTLVDLGNMMRVLSANSAFNSIDRETLMQTVQLESLKARLFVGKNAVFEQSDGEVTWL
ncbi:hypothetical protein XMV201_002422 [Aliiroseovarius sp. xm-v-201]|uniref:hypothetical protein n=1 Tax=unclassified Aliiroseovarius TaxID=2623558 RepID=UPI00156A259E|nr:MULTISPECIES: hypothetical protein [unclassified Aliiroseovarius]NRP50651.1 hypothetical protein [Aliiroseovarius sp. xm-m-354]NRQ05403.1 hypothetical protein [Aliiroseovarius sp. xm-m-309]NRQ08608.1 hypothetical protein [Aliiroseovarius sp. xm-v-201]